MKISTTTASTPPVDDIPVKRLRMDRSSSRLFEVKERAPFLRGPIPLAWLDAAAALPGKALHVALAIQWLWGMTKDKGAGIKLTRRALSHFHVSDDAASDALRRLEAADLIQVSRKAGQRPEITPRYP